MNIFRTGLKSFLFTCAAAVAVTGWTAANPAMAAAAAESLDVKVQINDELIHFPDAQPYIDENRLTQVPVRFVSEELGYNVQWTDDNGRITVHMRNPDGSHIEMVTGQSQVEVNGRQVELASAPKLKEGRVYIPLRFISETSGIRVQWDPNNFIAILNEDGQYHAPAWYKPKMELISTFTATGYSSSPLENGGYGAVDYFGKPLQLGTVAVDPNVIPLGTKLYIEGYDHNGLPAGGMLAVASDMGSAIKGNKMDIFIPGARDNALKFGIQQVKVYKLP